jgi:hypothetical protein
LEVLVSEEELAKLTKKKTGYERVKKGCYYYTVDSDDEIVDILEDNEAMDYEHYGCANYYSCKEIAKDNARADRLMRQLRRFAAENCEEVKWDGENVHWYFYYKKSSKELRTVFTRELHHIGCIYFDTEENAQKAIDTFKDELVWYFTEYRDRV